jgi:hypothetical protein
MFQQQLRELHAPRDGSPVSLDTDRRCFGARRAKNVRATRKLTGGIFWSTSSV